MVSLFMDDSGGYRGSVTQPAPPGSFWKQHLDSWPGVLPAVTHGIRMGCGRITVRRAEEITLKLSLSYLSSSLDGGLQLLPLELFVVTWTSRPTGNLHSGQGLLPAVLPEAEARVTSVRPEGLAPPCRLLTVPLQPVAKPLFVFLLTQAIFPSCFTPSSLK